MNEVETCHHDSSGASTDLVVRSSHGRIEEYARIKTQIVIKRVQCKRSNAWSHSAKTHITIMLPTVRAGFCSTPRALAKLAVHKDVLSYSRSHGALCRVASTILTVAFDVNLKIWDHRDEHCR